MPPANEIIDGGLLAKISVSFLMGDGLRAKDTEFKYLKVHFFNEKFSFPAFKQIETTQL